MAADLVLGGKRLRAQHLQDRPCAARHHAGAFSGRSQCAAVPDGKAFDRGAGAMPQTKSYLGTAQNRVDGRAKVTGAAKYAAEFNTPAWLTGSSSRARSPKAGSIRLMPRRRSRCQAFFRYSPTRTGRARRGSPAATATLSLRRARHSAPSTTTRSSIAASRSHWWWPKTSTLRVTRPRSCGSSTYPKRTGRIST